MKAAPFLLTTRAVISLLLAVFVIPGTAFGLYLFQRYAAAERARFAQEAQEVALSVTNVLETNLRGWVTTLQTLATSERLQRGDFEGFHRRALSIREFLGAEIVLRELDGRQLLNTRRPFGQDLPTTPTPVDRLVAEGGLPQITDVFRGVTTGTAQISVVVPVRRQGQVAYLLQMTAETRQIHDLVRPVVPPGWFVGVGDRAGVYVTRSEDHDVFSGQPGNAQFLATARGPSGTFAGQSIHGETILVGYARTHLADWLVAANVPQSLIDQPLRATLWRMGLVAAALFLAAAVAAFLLWRLLDRPLKALMAAGPRVAAGADVPDIPTRLVEFKALRDALADASRQIGRHTAELEERVVERTRELEASNRALAQAQKMEAVGNLTGGIAHDFNNLLQIINGNLELMAVKLKGQPEVARRLDNALMGVERGAKLAKQLLAFGRRQPLEPKVLNLGQVIRGMDDLLRRSLGGAVEIETVIAGGLWNTQIDQANFENALVNLAINARDAMPEGGRLTVEAANSFLDEAYSAQHQEVTAGQYVMVAVSDTGVGMGRDILSKVFEPFFTTKEVGKGSGLGLSMVYGFVKQSGGHIKIYSEPGQGTTMRLYFPRSRLEAVEGERVPVRSAEPGHEHILVVEDDAQVRETAVNALADLGYAVSSAESADAAWRMIGQGLKVDVIFTDVVMPGSLKSTDLVRMARERLPEVAVLFTSGYSENSIIHGGRLDPGVHLLSKPYRRDALARKIREVLDARGGAKEAASVPPAAKGRLVLVCEDEALIRLNVIDILGDLGHRAVEADCGQAALDRLRDGRVDVLITDIGLPDMDGRDLATQARSLHPGLAIIFATGTSDETLAARFAGAQVLHKPFAQEALAAALSRCP